MGPQGSLFSGKGRKGDGIATSTKTAARARRGSPRLCWQGLLGDGRAQLSWESPWHCSVCPAPSPGFPAGSILRVIDKTPQWLAGLLRLPVKGAGSERARTNCLAGSTESTVGGPRLQGRHGGPRPGPPRVGTGCSPLWSLLVTLLLPHSQHTQGLWGTPASSQLGALASSPHFFPQGF